MGREREVRLERADMDGAFPEGFYSTTNYPTEIFLKGRWIPVAYPEMDCGIRVMPERMYAETVPIHRVRRGDLIVVGKEGVRVVVPKEEGKREVFAFMSGGASPERPKSVAVLEVANALREAKGKGKKILFVAGPAVVHTGAAPYLAGLIREGWVDILFSGNALAVHDMEYAIFGTSLGVYLDTGRQAPEGHSHHLRTINAIRRTGSIEGAVKGGLIRKGIMYEVIRRGIPYVLAGSIRDDGPLPEVITNTVEAQDRMRELVRSGVEVAVMVATALHSIATGNILPATVKTVIVDINPAVVTKLVDRGTHQAVGIVTDAYSFLKELYGELAKGGR